MERLDNLAYEGINRYFHTLSVFGYKSYKETGKLIVLMFIEDLLRGSLSFYIDEKDYRTIENALYCLYGSTCLVPYPEFASGVPLVQILNDSIEVRTTEHGILRTSENKLIRLAD